MNKEHDPYQLLLQVLQREHMLSPTGNFRGRWDLVQVRVGVGRSVNVRVGRSVNVGVGRSVNVRVGRSVNSGRSTQSVGWPMA